MRPLPALSLALLGALACSAGAAEIRAYDVRVALDAGGAGRGTASLVLAGSPGETFDVPLATGWRDVRPGETSAGVLLAAPADRGATLRVTLPGAPQETHRAAFAFDVPAAYAKRDDGASTGRLTMPRDSRILRFAFVNTQVTPIRSFRALFLLPEGARVQAIREALPKPGRSETEPRVRLGGEAGLQTAAFRLSDLVQGDDGSMQVEVVPGRRSLLWLAAGLVLSVLYLVKFRDLVAPGGAAPPRT